MTIYIVVRRCYRDETDILECFQNYEDAIFYKSLFKDTKHELYEILERELK